VPKAQRGHAVVHHAIRLLREERERRGLSKYVVAARSGLSQQTIGYVERELTNPSFETIVRMADAISIDLPGLIRQACDSAVAGKSAAIAARLRKG
jgi:transcriptional regulator with XRE-family HTH domain